jgi:chromatin remodeling complex protein RSC6
MKPVVIIDINQHRIEQAGRKVFDKPRRLSDELCRFMKLPLGSMGSQDEVTRFIASYVKSNSCLDPTNNRRIIPDPILTELLRLKNTDMVTYLNLQSFLKVHYLK